MAVSLVDSMTGPWKPEEYHDTYRERVEKLVEDKGKGREIVTEKKPPEPTEVVDLSEALRHSVARAEKADRSKRGRKPQDLSELSKSELAEVARNLGVRGRSKMTRDELQDAVERAGESQQRTAS